MENFDKDNKIVKIEAIKVRIDLQKNFVMAFLIALFGITGYTFVHFEELEDSIEVNVIIIAVQTIIVLIGYFMGSIMKKVNKLEKL